MGRPLFIMLDISLDYEQEIFHAVIEGQPTGLYDICGTAYCPPLNLTVA
jgi:hypothetical protein